MALDDEMQRSLRMWRAWSDEVKARGWLADNVRKARFARLNERELLAALRDIPTLTERVAFLDVLCERVEQSSMRFQALVAGAMAHLAERHPGPGRDAVAVDHAIQRLLHRLSDSIGRPVALASLRSNRKPRKAAAWKYYRRHGLDGQSRDLIEQHFRSEESDEVSKIAADDADLVMRLGPDTVLEAAPTRYWRMKVFKIVLEYGVESEARLREAYPAEWLWAVAEQGDQDRLPLVLELLERNEANPDLVNRVLLCASKLRDREAIDQAISAAQRVLATPEPESPTVWATDGG